MKSLAKLRELFTEKSFDLEFESQMVQSRIVSTFLEVIEDKNITQKELEEKTGLSQPFISALLNNRKKLNVEHIARLQNALDVKLKSPEYISNSDYEKEYFKESEYTETMFVCEFKRPHQIDNDIYDKIILGYYGKFEEDNIISEKKLTNNNNKERFEYA